MSSYSLYNKICIALHLALGTRTSSVQTVIPIFCGWPRERTSSYRLVRFERTDRFDVRRTEETSFPRTEFPVNLILTFEFQFVLLVGLIAGITFEVRGTAGISGNYEWYLEVDSRHGVGGKCAVYGTWQPRGPGPLRGATCPMSPGPLAVPFR